MDKKEKASQAQKDDETLNKVLLWFAGAVILELVVLLVNRYHFHYHTTEIEFAAGFYQFMKVAQYGALALCAACIAWAVDRRKKWGRVSLLPVVAASVLGAVGIILILCLRFGSASVEVLQVAVPAAAVLVLIFYLYQLEFFTASFLGALGLLGLWLYRKASGEYRAMVIGFLVVAAAFLIAALVLSIRVQKSNGVWKSKGTEYQIVPRDASYGAVYLTVALVAAVLVAAVAAGAAVAYYSILGLLAWLFILAVYFTVKMM